jgi:L-amino acid N-acyltransferase YncA
MVRIADINDLESIVAIYNQAIDARFQVAFTERFATEDRIDWFREHTPGSFPVLVNEIEGTIAGWLSISPYRAGRMALRYTVDISYFVDEQHVAIGVGSALLAAGLQLCRDLGYKTALAIILDKNKASVRLAEKFGFERWAYLPDVADFGGEECSHLYYGVRL